jgi:hypothetical protein
MRTLVRYLSLVSLLIGIQFCNAADTPVRTEKEAAAIAEAAFLKHTKHTITEYSIHPTPHTPKEWHFVIMGEKQFVAIGNDWVVIVNRQTGATEITKGM